MKYWILFLLVGSLFNTSAQDLTVSPEILEELETVQLKTETDTFLLRVAYPKNYETAKTYKCFLGLSGGTQSREIVDYCYAAWFRSGYFQNYITIMPVVEQGDTVNLKDYDRAKIADLLKAINERFKLESNWLIAGTSNGGEAAFRFVDAFPERFEGLITAPGLFGASIVPDERWEHLSVIMAYGTKDHPDWIKGTKACAKQLKKIVKSIKVVPLKDQGHILPVSFNADKMYDPYFLPE